MLVRLIEKRARRLTENGRYYESPQRRGSNGTSESYEEVKKLIDGGQGKVCVVKRKSDKKILVRKEQKDYSMFGDMPCEMHILENVLTHHPRIIEFETGNYLRANNALVLYFKYYDGGDLGAYIPRLGDYATSETFLWDCFTQLAEAIAFLHYGYRLFASDPNTPPRGWARVIHRDIKPHNVFLRHKLTSKSPVPELVLGDFGLATMRSDTYGAGTTEWIGPEIPLCTKQGDVWGVGATIHALAHGRGPVSPTPVGWRRSKWEEAPQARQPMQLSRYYSIALNQNMMDCLTRDPNKRVTSVALLKRLLAERPRSRRR